MHQQRAAGVLFLGRMVSPAFEEEIHVLNSDTAGCKIMLLPMKRLNGALTYDTAKFKPLAEIGANINGLCVRPVELGGRGLGGLEFAGDLCCPQSRGWR